MPHPTPVQIAYGSATVISTTLLLMFIVPTGSTLALALVAIVALTLGVVVAVATQPRRGAPGPTGEERPAVPAVPAVSAVPARSFEAPAAARAPAPAPAATAAHLPPAERPEVRV
jgi:hypothetical protein